MTLLVAAIPVFLALVFVEWLVSQVRERPVFRLTDTLADLGCGMLAQLTGIFVAVLSVGAYRVVETHWSLQVLAGMPPWPAGVPGAVLAFLLADLGQYLVHRLSHRVSFLWACHVVHHSSEELNYAVALRNTSLHGLFTWVFTLPLAAMGLPWQLFAAAYGLNVAWQFWLHTRLIGKLGPLERVLNTPSHHRVHHGRDAAYVDRNFGGVLIIWDRLFGTFAPEGPEPSFGVEPPLRSNNPVWANLDGWWEVGRAWRRARGMRGKLRAVFGPPDWPSRAETPTPPVVPAPRVAGYALLQLAAALAVTLAVLQGPAPRGVALAGLVAVAGTLGVSGGLLDGRRWAAAAEWTRLAVIAVAALTFAMDLPWPWPLALLAYLASSVGGLALVHPALGAHRASAAPSGGHRAAPPPLPHLAGGEAESAGYHAAGLPGFQPSDRQESPSGREARSF